MRCKYGVTDGGFARVTTDYGQCTLKVVVSERQQRGMLFAPIHWSEANATGGARRRAGGAVHRSILRPAREQGDAGVDRALRICLPRLCAVARRRSNCPSMPGGRASPSPAAMAICSPTMPISRGWQIWLRVAAPATISPNTGILAAAFIARPRLPARRIETCLFIGPAHDAGDWNVVKSLFAADTLSDEQRRMLLSGKSVDGLASAGPVVCACFGVGRTTICDAIAARRAHRRRDRRAAEGRHQLRLVHSGIEAADRADRAACRSGAKLAAAN